MKTINYILHILVFSIVSLMVLLLTILNWGVLVFFIIDILFLDTPETSFVYKIWGGSVFMFIVVSHSLFCILLYNRMYDKIIMWIKFHSTHRLVFLTLGYINTYFLDLYYLRNKYSRGYLLYQSDLTIFISMFPILNILCYIDMIRSLRKCVSLPSNRDLIKLYLKGQLMTYIIRKYDDYDL